MAYFIASVSSTMDAANAALPAYITSLLLFVGLLIRKNDQPVWWRWYASLQPPSSPASFLFSELHA